MTPEIIMATDKQVWSHLLCRDCEQLISKKGEDYVMRLVENGEDFPLLSRLRVAMAIRVEADCVIFSGSAIGIDTSKLGYYALSVVWRAAVENWKSLKGQTTTVDLGTFEEPVRKYLIGETGFPAGVAVMVVVCNDLGSQQTIYFPKDSKNSNLYPTFGFLVRGLLFRVITDVGAGAPELELCCVNSAKKVIFLRNCEANTVHGFGHLHKTARVASNVGS
jgi:hypothetical protein